MLILFKKCPCLCSPLHTRHSLCHPRGLPNKPLCPNCSFLNPFFVTRPIIARFILNLNQLHKFLTFLSEILGFIHIRLPTYSSASNLMMPGSKGLSPHTYQKIFLLPSDLSHRAVSTLPPVHETAFYLPKIPDFSGLPIYKK